MALSVRERLGDLLVAIPYGLETLLRLVTIEETRDIPTAAVPLGRDPRLLINPDFVEAHCQTDEALYTLVLHELHHVLLGHTRLYSRLTPAHNVAFDAVINAMLCRRNPTPAWTALFRDLYRPDHFPECLLRPPPGFPYEIAYPEDLDPRWKAALVDLYENNSGTFADVFELLAAELNQAESPLLLGHHGDGNATACTGSAKSDPDLFRVVSTIARKFPAPFDSHNSREQRSLEQILDSFQVTAPSSRSPHRVLRWALLSAARAGRTPAGPSTFRPFQGQGAWPSRDRRAFALAAAGQQPLLYEQTFQGPPRRRRLEPVDVYVDVSPSCGNFIPALYAAVASCRHLVAPRVHVFSGVVKTVTMAQLQEGVVWATGGTCGASVTDHITTTKSRAAVVLTDGLVGAIPADHLTACRRARLQVVLTPGGSRRDLAPVTTAFHNLESP